MLQRFAYVRPDTLEAAIEHLAAAGSRVHAGGTDLLGCLREHIIAADTLVSLSSLDNLRGIVRSGGARIGALTTIAAIAADPLIRQDYAALAQAAAEVASPQLRNQGTIGGNLCQKPRCWYYRGDFHCLRKGGGRCFAVGGENAFHCIFGGEGCYIVHPSDTAPALAALGARVHIQGSDGRRSVPADKFHVLPAEDYTRETVLEAGEIVTAVELPPPPPGLKSSYRKVRARRAWDFALAGAALALVFEGERISAARVFLSGAAPVPWRARAAEERITGGKLDAKAIAEAAAAAVRDATPMGQNAYKIPLFRNMLEEELTKLAGL